ncbi:MAG: nucleotidyl transferase AbiEii/AbiGii toxin family protein [Candidatus Magasanikbacteria bacterium]|nr:nucleotidyl transferase AbiEii/AbiGii toxin family protein [Candidatus Magasanikbacteria bacterium]
MYTNTLAVKTAHLLKILSTKKWIQSFYLAGGTALALQYGHRQSIDLDFFCKKNINTKQLIQKLSVIGSFTLIQEEENTVEGILNGVKISFMTYPYILIQAVVSVEKYVFMAHKDDIAVMKLGAITGRNTKKDFIDLYWYMTHEKKDMRDMALLTEKKFNGFDFDMYHIYKSLVYFIEADKEPMPLMLESVKWNEVKDFFKNEIKHAMK